MEPKSLILRPRSAVWLLLLLWMAASAFYYAEHLFSPNFYLGYDEGTLHKTLKYIACAALSFCFCIIARAWSMLAACALLLVVAGFLMLDRGSLEIATLSIMTTATMLPFALVPALWEERLRTLGRVMVFCGAVVGVFSIVELTVLSALFEAAWGYTGAIRSVSTLFNPNNLGLYVSVCLLLLPYMKLRPLWLALCGGLLLFALVASGSRTAWVALVVVLGYEVMTNAQYRNRLGIAVRRHAREIFFIGLALAAAYTVYQLFKELPDIEVRYRGTDLYTANIRLENFLTFLDLVDASILVPDFRGVRADLIQDSFYLIVLNSFGIIGLLLLTAFLVTHFSPSRSRHPDLIPWRMIFAFYMVSGLSGSQLNSFPNNQIFFLSMGALWVYRPAIGHSMPHPVSVKAS